MDRLPRQRNHAGMDVQQVRWIIDMDGNIITSEEGAEEMEGIL